MAQARKKKSLNEWINEKGINHIAEMLNVNPNTVRYWKHGNTYPRVEQMRLIKKLTRGVVGYAEIIDGDNKIRHGRNG